MQSAFYPWSAVVCILPSVCISTALQSAVRRLRFIQTEPMIRICDKFIQFVYHYREGGKGSVPITHYVRWMFLLNHASRIIFFANHASRKKKWVHRQFYFLDSKSVVKRDSSADSTTKMHRQICNLSRKNVLYGIRSNGWHGKWTGNLTNDSQFTCSKIS